VDRCEECGFEYELKLCGGAPQWVAVHTVHEMQHHLLDVRRQLD